MEAMTKGDLYFSHTTQTGSNSFFLAPRVTQKTSLEGMQGFTRQRMTYTYPERRIPVMHQLDSYLRDPASIYNDAQTRKYAHVPFGDLGVTTDPKAIAIKELIVEKLGDNTPLEVIATMTLAVFYATLPSYVSRYHGFAETYDIQADLHWAKDVYGKGVNGSEGAFKQLTKLARERVQAIPGKKERRDSQPVAVAAPTRRSELALTELIVAMNAGPTIVAQNTSAVEASPYFLKG